MISQDVTSQGLTQIDLLADGHIDLRFPGFFVVATDTTPAANQEFTRAGSFSPDSQRQSRNTPRGFI